MSLLDNIAPAPRRVMTLFYVVDASGSMSGTKIGTVNNAMEEAIQSDLKEISAANDDAEIKVAILKFSTDSEWITPSSGPVSIEELFWNDLPAGGLTDLGHACKELNQKLSRTEYLKSQTGAYAPVILLFSDGGPTDDWQSGLRELKQNNWFKHAIKIAIAIGKDADKRVLAEFTGTPEAVITVDDKNTLKALIRKVSVRASEFQSHSKQSGDLQTSAEDDSARIAQDTVEEIRQEQQDDAVVPPSTADSESQTPVDVDIDQGWDDSNW